jgi:hypothetical protein
MSRFFVNLTVAVMLATGPTAASFAQAATRIAELPEPDNEALRVCILSQLGGVTPNSPTAFSEITGDLTWFMFERVRNEPDANLVGSMNSSWLNLRSDDAEDLIAQSAVLRPLCAKRWPASQRDRIVKLPTDEFDRAGVCLGNASVLQGAAKASGESQLLVVTKRVIDWYSKSLSDTAMTQHDFGGDQGPTKAITAWLRAGHELGNPNTILATCNSQIPH